MPDDDKGGQQGDAKQEGGETLTFEAWHEKQDEPVKALVEGHVKGLKSALEAERGQRKEFERQLRDAAKQLEKGSDARKALEEQADRVKALERQSSFYDAAHAAGCVNLRLAFLAAQDAGLVKDDGTADFAAMKDRFPQLFGVKTAPAGHAGAGGTSTKPDAKSMNSFIRRAAGIGG